MVDEYMRMWNVNTNVMCRQHLLGEHRETHTLIGCLRKGISVKGYVDKGLVEISNIKKRHDKLVKEMNKRGYNHKTPITEYYNLINNGHINSKNNLIELARRCTECRKMITNARKNKT